MPLNNKHRNIRRNENKQKKKATTVFEGIGVVAGADARPWYIWVLLGSSAS